MDQMQFFWLNCLVYHFCFIILTVTVISKIIEDAEDVFGSDKDGSSQK